MLFVNCIHRLFVFCYYFFIFIFFESLTELQSGLGSTQTCHYFASNSKVLGLQSCITYTTINLFAQAKTRKATLSFDSHIGYTKLSIYTKHGTSQLLLIFPFPTQPTSPWLLSFPISQYTIFLVARNI